MKRNEQSAAGSIPALKYDGTLSIARGASRMAKQWKNVQVSWGELVQQLSKTVRTGETLDQYMKMEKSQQDQIKDVGGFVGGTLKQGRRLADAVANRQIVTLDADTPSGDADLWETYDMMLGNGALLYSTHKHQPSKPRLRLVIPLSRPVTSEEYQPIARRIAQWLGIDQFDDTTYQPHRLMYYPSTSQGAEFRFEYIDAPWIDADKILDTYPDWRDTSYWPESSRQTKVLKARANKQGDPEDKPGIVGAFCRTYDVPSAIERFLPDQYTPAGEGRYSYVGGSTAAGLILYQGGKFAYSHHGTDPVSGLLVNSFDMVRHHLYVDQDTEAAPGTPTLKLPSYRMMKELAAADLSVKKTILAEREATMYSDFDVIEDDEAPSGEAADATDDKAYVARLEYNGNGQIKQTINNAYTVMMHKKQLKGTFGLNEFTGRINVKRDLPWRKRSESLLWTDTDDADLRHYLEQTHGLEHKGNIETAFMSVSRMNRYHPVREYLHGVEWDEIGRLDTVLIDYLGAEDTSYTRAVTRKTLVAAVARIMEPGTKFDYMLTLVGKQGIGKSSIFHLLAGSWFSDSFHTFQGKEAYEQLQGAWIVEMAELAAARKADVEALKQFLTKQVDSYRVAYGRHVSEFKRQSIFIGTTNDYEFLRDRTGNRRFWVIEAGKEKPRYNLWDDLTPDEVAQIWAEAVHRYNEGEPLILSAEDNAYAEEKQASHSVDSPLTGMIEKYLDIPITENWNRMNSRERKAYIQDSAGEHHQRGDIQRDRVCALEIWIELLEGNRNNFRRPDMLEILNVLRSIEGWNPPDTKTGKLDFGSDYGVQRAFLRDKVRAE